MAVPTASWDETSPAGSDDISQGDDRIREAKTQVREVVSADHQFNSSGSSDENGQHKQVTFLAPLGSDPTNVANKGFLYTKDVSSVVELFWEDESGNVIQLTSLGVLQALGAFRSGDMLLSSNTGTPSGWTDVSATYNNKFLRVTSGTPLTAGGSDTHDHGAATGSHVLDITEIPAHTHTVPGDTSGGSTLGLVDSRDAELNESVASGSAGGGLGHTHTIASDNNVPAYIELRMYKKS